jgi:hypothetical protein
MGSEFMHEFGLAVTHLNCGMETEETDHTTEPSEDTISVEECCENQFELLQNDSESQLKIQSISSPQFIFLEAFTNAFVFTKEIISNDFASNSPFAPPLIPQDFIVLYETFLI